ncbi:LOW QUALITY PROTEIN: hypothetical protein PHMEG_00031987, partial [Phytophthora megakarya]
MANGMQNQMLTVLQAALSQIAPNPATGMQSDSPSPHDSANLNPVRAAAVTNSQTSIVGTSPTVASVQQSVAVDQKREIKRETLPVKSATRQESSNASQTPPTARRTEPQVARKTTVRKEGSTSSSSKRPQSKKAKEKCDPPPDGPDVPEPSDSDNDASRGGSSDSSDAEGFSSQNKNIGMTTTTTTADGTTIWNCRPYLGYTNLEKFDKKASRDNRVNWWERFSDMASQGSWSDAMKILQEPDAHSNQGLVYAATQIYTSRLETNVTQIQEAVYRYHWLIFGRYFTMKMTDHETPLQFFYRLNATAVKAEVKFKSSSNLRESHIRRFIKKLHNDQLKTALEGHRFQNITDLERALRRHEDVWREEGYDSPTPKKSRYFCCADNVHQGRTQNRGPTRRQGRVFVTQGDAEPTQESEFQHESQNTEVFAEQTETHSKPILEFPNSGIDGEVFRVAEKKHWKSPNPHPRQGVARPENWDVFCEKCVTMEPEIQ